MNEAVINDLKNFGLQPNEARVYLAILEQGRGTVAKISRGAGLNRTTGYDILERLCLYGIVNRVLSGKKKHYIAEPPFRLKQFLENKKHKLDKYLEELNEILPQLQMLYKTELKPAIKFAEGKKEMELMYLGILNAKSTIYSILNLKHYAEIFDDLGTYQADERARRKIKEKNLAIKNDTALWWYDKTYKTNKYRRQYTEYRWIEPRGDFKTSGEIMIFDDKVIGLLTQPKENVAFEIQSQTLADFLKIVFEMAWGLAKPA